MNVNTKFVLEMLYLHHGTMEPINSNECSQHDPTPTCLQYIQYCPNSKLSFIKDPNNEAKNKPLKK